MSTPEPSLLMVRGDKLGKHRLVPHEPRIPALVGEQAARHDRAAVMGAQALIHLVSLALKHQDSSYDIGRSFMQGLGGI